MTSIGNLKTVHQQFDILSSLKENERIHVKWRGYSKYKAPDRILKDSKNVVLRGFHHVITFAMKIIQAFGRLLTFQSTGKEIVSLKKLSKKTVAICDHLELTNDPDAAFYKKLNVLGKVHDAMEETLQSKTLEKYQETVRSGNPQLFKGNKKKREKYAKDVEEIIGDLQKNVAPKVGNLIDQIESSLFQKDREKVTHALDSYLKGAKHKSLASEENNYFTAKALRDVMYNLYGKDASEKALKRYGLDNARAINEKELQIVVTGMLANLTLSDLKSIYNNRSKELLHISKLHKDSPKKFDDLSQQEVCEFMGDLCSIVHKQLRVGKKSPHLNQLRHDKILLNYFRLMNHYHPEKTAPKGTVDISRFAYTEYLSRYMTYSLFNDDKANFPDGILIPLFDTKGNLVLKEAHTIVSKNGLHGVVFKPAIVEECVRPDLQVAFRGTYCSQSMLRDLSFTEKEFWYGFEGPGRRSFRKSENEIIENVMKHFDGLYKQSGEKVRVEFLGHSLGASDAQRALEKFTDHVVGNSGEQEKVAAIKLFAYNSPSIESDVAKRFIKNVYKTPINFKLRYFDADNDPVQGAGKVRLGYRSKESYLPENLYASCYRFNRNLDEKIEMMAANFFKKLKFWSKRASTAHTAPFFCGIYPSKKIKNMTYIDEVVTNHPKDSKMRFGPNLEVVAEMSSDEEINETMRTPMWYVARKIKRAKNKFLGFFSYRREATAR